MMGPSHMGVDNPFSLPDGLLLWSEQWEQNGQSGQDESLLCAV